MRQYLDLIEDILNNGEQSDDRTGTGTISVFGRQMRFDLKHTFPTVTTKKLLFKSVTSELLWFISGSSNVNDLRALHYGEEYRDNADKVTIWDANYNKQAKELGYTGGELGPIYGSQWRSWNGHIDQLSEAISLINNDPNNRRILVSSWNVERLSEMTLPPCHSFFQFRVLNGKLSCQVYIRSNDIFLGCPFNIASYALLTCMVAQVTNLIPYELVLTIGDAHIYLNHIEQVKQQLSRECYGLPKLDLNPDIKNIDDFTMNDISLVQYKHHDIIRGPMAA